MGIEDRDWYREERKRREKLPQSAWRGLRGRDGRQLVRGLSRWGLVAVAAYLAWSVFRG